MRRELALCALAACAPTTPTLDATPIACSYPSFVATVRAGPSAGRVFTGDLELHETEAGHLEGTLAGAAVVGQYTHDTSALELTLPAGADASGALAASAKLNADFSRCPSPIDGFFLGPAMGDQGDFHADKPDSGVSAVP